MIVMQLSKISKSFAGNTVLKDIDIEIKRDDRIAIVGKNGAGKSTLLKIMTKQLDYDDGDIYQPKVIKIGYLAQQHNLHTTHTIWEEMLSVFSALREEENELAELTEKISKGDSFDEKLMNEYSRRQEQFEQAGGYRYKSDIKGVLTGLGFHDHDFDLQIHKLSGGQKTRIALGKLLLENPHVLILDEPTNHLDIPTLTWLENYLINYDGAIVIVSHDRYFLDKIVTKVYEIAHQRAHTYVGTYTTFLKKKMENYERDVKQYEKQQQEIKEMEEFIDRNIARASTTKRAQSRRKQLEKMERMDRPILDHAQANFSFEVEKTSGNDVLATENYSFHHEKQKEPLFSNVSFAIRRGDRIALIGENGVGKTTLLKAILQDHTSFHHGANVQIGYYAQEQESLDERNTILEEVWSAFPHKTELEIRTTLGNFLFSGEDVLKPISTLSGGEKARVALAKLMLQKANFLILDEPTNHLDLASKEMLEASLEHYPGTILFVSHDRYFINKIADQIFELQQNGLTTYLGNYDYYMEKKAQLIELKKLEQGDIQYSNETNHSHITYTEQKQLQREQRKKERQITKLENEIEELDLHLEKIEEEMVQPENLNDHEVLTSLANESTNIKEKLEHLMEEWEKLQE